MPSTVTVADLRRQGPGSSSPVSTATTCSYATEGGPVFNNKGISLPGMNVSVPALSEKDIDDLKFARTG